MSVSEHTQQGLNGLSYINDQVGELKDKQVRMVAAILEQVLAEESPSALRQLIGLCAGTDITLTDLLHQLHDMKFPNPEGQ